MEQTEQLQHRFHILKLCLQDCLRNAEVYSFFINNAQDPHQRKRPMEEYLTEYNSLMKNAAGFIKDMEGLVQLIRLAEEKEERELAS